MRICKKCQAPKELEDYPKHPHMYEGRDNVCKLCRNTRKIEQRKTQKLLGIVANEIEPEFMPFEEIAKVLNEEADIVKSYFYSGMLKLQSMVKGDPQLAESLWMFMEKELDKGYRPSVPYSTE